MEKYQSDFIKKISAAVIKYAPKYDIKVYSPIIAQAILESAFGKSKLADYNNFFGMKTGSSYKGQSVEFETKEVIKGKSVTVKASFRSFKTLNAGVKGYFDFINTSRYQSLKGVTDPRQYLENIKAAGYATDPNYVSALMAVIDKYNLTEYDSEKTAEKQPKNSGNIEAALLDKTLDIIASDIIKNVNFWGCGDIRKGRLYKEVQTRINRICYQRLKSFGDAGTVDSALYMLASDIIKHPQNWGNGNQRKDKIYEVVQDHVNKLLKR